jgi:hypothetical protein
MIPNRCERRTALCSRPNRLSPGLRESDSFKDELRRSCILGVSFWVNEETSRIAREFGAVQLLDKGDLVATLIPAIKRCVRQGREAQSA